MAYIEKIDFWPYEIFGYLIPGAFFAIVVTINNKPASDLLSKVSGGYGLTSCVIVFILISYVLGHIISALSSLILERVLLASTLRYPTGVLLNLPRRDSGVFATIGCVLMNLQPLKFTKYISESIPSEIHDFKPIEYLGYSFIARGYGRKYSDSFSKAFKDKFCSIFAYDQADLNEHDIYWHCWQWALLRGDDRLYKYGYHFIDLYGFCRNTSMVLFLFILLPRYSDADGMLQTNNTSWLIIVIFSGVFMFGNYAKLMRRHNDIIYRSFYVSQVLPIPSMNEPPPIDATGKLPENLTYQNQVQSATKVEP